MFAKLFNTSLGQFLLTKVDDDSGEPLLVARYSVKSPIEGADATITKTGRYEATDEGEERRDNDFYTFTKEKAEAMAQEGF